jgi:hypothetical protein
MKHDTDQSPDNGVAGGSNPLAPNAFQLATARDTRPLTGLGGLVCGLSPLARLTER